MNDAALAPGTRVEVMSSADRSWKRGFQIEAEVNGNYRLRRDSDGAVLAVPFPARAVRPQPTRPLSG